MILTNIVEYDIRPDYDAFCCMSYQEGTKYLAELLLESIGVIAANMKKYPHFDFERFALDLKEALEQIVATNLSDPHTAVGGGGLERSGVNSQLSDNHSSTSKRPIEDFPIEALTFVERELPNVHWAVEQKNRELLKPVLARAQEFLNRWGLGGKYTPALDAYPGYATLVTDVLREGAVELMETTDEERARVHEDFRKRWDACKAAMSQDRRPRSH